MYDNDDLAPCATVSESISEWARNVGWHDYYKDSQYLLTDYDTWVINPHYTGPNQPHPEADEYDEETEQEAADAAEWEAYQNEKNREAQERWEDGQRDEPADDLPW